MVDSVGKEFSKKVKIKRKILYRDCTGWKEKPSF